MVKMKEKGLLCAFTLSSSYLGLLLVSLYVCVCVCVCVCGPGIPHIVGTYICLHSHVVGTRLPYGDKKQVP